MTRLSKTQLESLYYYLIHDETRFIRYLLDEEGCDRNEAWEHLDSIVARLADLILYTEIRHQTEAP